MCYQIHETVIRDIVDIISDVRKSDEVEWLKNKNRSFSSIAKASSNLTLVFPVLVSKNMNIENAAMISKAIERKATTMLQMLFSAINITDSKNGIEYLKNFHTNLKIDDTITVDGFIDAMDKYVIKNEATISFDNRRKYEQIKEDMKNLDFVLPDSINEQSLNDFRIYPQSYFGDTTIIREAREKVGSTTYQTKYRNVFGQDVIQNDVQNHYADVPDPEPVNRERDYYQKSKDKIGIIKTAQDMKRTQILDTDVKKANELVPTMMIINYIDNTTGEPIHQNMIIGIKAKIYALDSTDIINRISIKNQDHHGLLKFIKATTREISFFRDFLFAIDKAKIDALSQSKRGSSSKLWKILERRSIKSKVRRSMGRVNDASAISTLVISQEEVEYLKKTENINVEDPKVIRPIMESYNLMGFCIVDETMEIAKFIFDTGNDIYETMSFTLLERETSDNGYKKVINLMTKIAR